MMVSVTPHQNDEAIIDQLENFGYGPSRRAATAFRAAVVREAKLREQVELLREAVAHALIFYHGMTSTDPVLVAFDEATNG